MTRRERDGRRVVEPDHVGDETFDRTVDQHDRNAAARKRLQQFFLHAERVHDHAFDAVRREQLQIAALHVDFVGRVADERHVAERVTRGFDALQHFDRIRIGQVGEQHADQPVAAALQAARHLVRPVVELRDRRFDALAQFRRQHARLAVQIARDAGLAGAGFARDIGDRRAARRRRWRSSDVGLHACGFHRLALSGTRRQQSAPWRAHVRACIFDARASSALRARRGLTMLCVERAVQRADQIFRRVAAHRVTRLVRRRADVRQRDDVLHREERRIGGQRFLLEHVETRAENRAVLAAPR